MISKCANAANGLRYLRAQKIVHRDMKPQNILLHFPDNKRSSLPLVKIADFGFARYLEQDMAATFCGSPLYMVRHAIAAIQSR